jgi:hypothetical protein
MVRLIGSLEGGQLPGRQGVETYDLADVNGAFADSEPGAIVKPPLVL